MHEFRNFAVLCGILLMATSPAFGEVIAEGFDINPHGENPPTFCVLGQATSTAAQETVQRAAASNFAWAPIANPARSPVQRRPPGEQVSRSAGLAWPAGR